MGNIARKLPQHGIRYLQGANKSSGKGLSKCPTVVNTQPAAEKAATKIVNLPIKTEKEMDTKTPLSKVVQQPSQGIVRPPGALIPTIDVPLSVRPPPKPPNVGPDPNMDIEENSPHQEGIITETDVVLDQSYLEQPQELIKLVNILKVVQKYLLQQADIEKILNIIKRSAKRYAFTPHH